MKRILFYAIAFIPFIISCEKEKEEDNGPQAITLDVLQGEFNKATVSGQITGLEGVALDFECGIEYSTSASFAKDSTWQVKAEKNYSEDVYTVTLSNLQSQCIYYYRAYFINQLLKYYGGTKHFSFFWKSYEELLIGSWTANNWNYIFNEDHTGSRSQSGRTQFFTWSLDGDELELGFLFTDTGGKTFIIYVIDSYTSTGFNVYDIEDFIKEIIAFVKQ